ncbi:phospholipase A and acyltransferase 3-like [Eublepharis macularius]|uniref:Phospholipase A and acyltransferase 3-like n=1 Tax=Eublepharis macularius TaxID=481883 RepID=A0AA97JL80_EUBMA|nr:phospholipase A and acyltransferase 3-like [Eublepharis macularius]
MSWGAQMTQVDPKPGDLIEVFRPLYQHWAIYIGNGNVVHLAPESEVAGAGIYSLHSVACNKAVVKKEPLWKVVGEDKYQINNKYDRRHSRLPVHEIIFRAKAEVGRVMDYSVFNQNCEHFVTGLRYGSSDSDQVTDGFDMGGAVVAGIVGIAGIAAAVCLANKVVERRRQDQ